MTRKQEIPHLKEKVLFVGKAHDLGHSTTAIANKIDFSDRTLNEAINGEPVRGRKGLTKEKRDELAKCLGIGADWPEYFDPQGQGRDGLEAFKDRHERDGELPPCKQHNKPGDLSPLPAFSGTRQGAAWALKEILASILLFSGQYDGADLDFEISGGADTITITDEESRILLQRKLELKHCIIEIDLGGAQIRGGLERLQSVVDQNTKARGLTHLGVEVRGSARSPRLILSVFSGELGILRPLNRPAGGLDEDARSLIALDDVTDGTLITARVRVYDWALQDRELTQASLAQFRDDGEAPVGQRHDRSLPVDDRVRIMMHLWKEAARDERGPRQMPGQLVLSIDQLKFEVRPHV